MRRVRAVPAIVCAIATLLTTGCTSVAALAVLYIAFDDNGNKRPTVADPDHPAAYRVAATLGWIDLLQQQGAAVAEDSLYHPRPDLQQRLLSRELDVSVRDQIARAVRLAEKRARGKVIDADVYFQVGAAYGLRALYLATVEGNRSESLRAAERAYTESLRALVLDPNHKNAGMIVGTYRYAMSTLSPPAGRTAHLGPTANLGRAGGRERSIQMVKDAARDQSDMQTIARFILIVIYNREDRHEAALAVIRQLQQRFPGNRLLWLEAGNTMLNAGRPLDAQRALEQGLAQFTANSRPLAFGELARWRNSLGAALVALEQYTRASHELKSALLVPARPWIHGRTRIELGKIADLAGDRAGAIQEYEQAARLCASDADEAGAREARTLAKEGYRTRSAA